MTNTWNSRLDVVEALEAAGWTGDPEHPLTLLRHPLGAVFGVHSESGDCGLDTPDSSSPAEFPGSIPGAVVIAACLAASHQDPTAALGLELHEERQDHARTRTALASAKRRALRRLPHEREGLIFHLERRNRRLEELVELANATAGMTAKVGTEAATEAYSLRERVGHLQARVRDLELQLKGRAKPCGRELSTGEPCPDHPRPAEDAVPDDDADRIVRAPGPDGDPLHEPVHYYAKDTEPGVNTPAEICAACSDIDAGRLVPASFCKEAAARMS